MSIIVLGGAGAMGQVIVKDLAEFAAQEEVVIADYNLDKAKELAAKIGSKNLRAIFADVTDAEKLAGTLAGAKVVINSTPYYFNLNVMQAALEASCHYLDLGGLFHTTRKQLELHKKFEAKNLLAVLGAGAAPGMTNVMAAHGQEGLDTCESIDITVGCVDFLKSSHPFAVPYALDTIFDEYTAEPMVFENGKFAAVPPMSGEIELDLGKPVGISHAIYTLHSEVATLPLAYQNKGIKRVTFRLGLPKDFHDKLKFLVDLGMASSDLMEINGGKCTPRQFFAKLIQKIPNESQDPDDCETIRVDVCGKSGGKDKLVRVESTIYAHKKWKVSCGALDTGVPPSIVAQMIAGGEIQARGVLAPETCIQAKPFFAELAKRSIEVNTYQDETLSPQGLASQRR